MDLRYNSGILDAWHPNVKGVAAPGLRKAYAVVDPSKIVQVGMGFWASKTLLVAVKLGLFTELAREPLSGEAIKERLGLHERALYDFLDALVALGFLERTGFLKDAVYANAPDVDTFLDRNKPSYMGGILEMMDSRSYDIWGRLEEGLKSGTLQNEARTTGQGIFDAIYSDDAHLRGFLNAMSGIQMGNFMAFGAGYDFSRYATHCDIGGAGGQLAIQVAAHNPHLQTISFDLPRVTEVAAENIAGAGLTDQVRALPGDMFNDPFPKADVITMGSILHDWDLAQKQLLVRKAYDALPEGGAFAVIETIIDDERRGNVFGLLMSINMLLETEGGFDYSAADFKDWAMDAGFARVEVMPLTGPSSAVIAYK